MKLQLTVFAQELQSTSQSEACNPFAVVAHAPVGEGKSPVVIGKTEVLRNTLNPDFTKIFLIDYYLGQTLPILVTIHDSSNENRPMGSAVFDIGSVLGKKGGILGKQVRTGGYVMVHVERASGMGLLTLQLRGLNFVSQQDQIDPYFEIQKKRKNTKGETVWDVVYRSLPVEDDASPVWTESSLDFGSLCGGDRKEKLRISVKDYDDVDDSLIGSCLVTVDKLIGSVTDSANMDSNDVDTSKALILKRPRPLRETGKLVVGIAQIANAQNEEEEEEIVVSPIDFDDLEDESTSPEASDDVEIPTETLCGEVTFADYIAGGCQLKVVVGIDYTASNGDPRKEDSLHHFSKDGMNQYESAIQKICSILAKYDTDSRFPVYGFGAKKAGKLSHCFPAGDIEEAVGVDGVLKAYKAAFRSGIAMSAPTNIIEIVQKAGSDAVSSMDGEQEYTILSIFTNGSVHSVEETIAAIDDVQDSPLSIVVVGVGPGQFEGMDFLSELQSDGRRVHFVDMKKFKEEELAQATLSDIPKQLCAFFQEREILPKQPIETDEIVIEPFSEEDAIATDIAVSDNGDIAVHTDAPPSQESSAQPTSKLQSLGKKGKSIFLSQAKRQFGRVRKNMERKITRSIDQKVNQMFGIPTGRKKRRGRRY